jgi:peptidoglycan/xylan/chitin deacetylase (PgdA/CDA1 family)
VYNCNLRILSYHRFGERESEYAFSRTYKQFAHDLGTKDFDWITMDDGHKTIVKACEMMREKNFRAKLFISTALVGTKGYCSWDDLWRLSRHHDIENHSHEHVILTRLQEEEIRFNIEKANIDIKHHTGARPRYFVPPWNQSNDVVLKVATALGLQLVHSRVDIRNDSR